MSSEPTDLIRAVDERHVRVVLAVHEGHGEEAWCPECGTRWPCEVRRLRDAYADQVDTTKLVMTSLNEALDVLAKASGLPDEATKDIDLLYETVLGLRPALAEANTTIQRIEALIEERENHWTATFAVGHGGVKLPIVVSTDNLRRAIDGPQS